MKAFLFFTYLLISIFGLGNASAADNNTLYFQSTRSLQYGTTMTQDINRKYRLFATLRGMLRYSTLCLSFKMEPCEAPRWPITPLLTFSTFLPTH